MIVVIAATWLALGCATASHGTRQRVTISSDPPGASAHVEPGGHQLTTPAEIELERKRDYRIRFELAGYVTREAVLGRDQSAATLGNAGFGGPIGFGVDAATGAAYELGPDPFHVVLEPTDGRAPDPAAARPLDERTFHVVFFNEAVPTRKLTIDDALECKLGRNQFMVRELNGGSHRLRIAHWDLVWLEKERELTIDGAFTHVGLVLNATSDDYVLRHGLPTPRKSLFKEACREGADGE